MTGERPGIRAFACLPGNEDRVLEELRALLPRARARSRAPGLLLVEDPDLDPRLAIADPVHPVFARAELTFWGEASSPGAVAAAMLDVLEEGGQPPALHVWPAAGASWPESRAIDRALRRRLGGRVRSKIEAAVGDEVLDAALVPPGRLVYGAHRRTPLMSGFPGGIRRLRARPEAPSRAHLKLEEGLEWAALPLRPGDEAIDVGCAPGGWSFVLLERGLHVHGVDPTPVAPALARYPAFTHHRVPVSRFDPRAARAMAARWLFWDMNGPPAAALGQLLRFAPRLCALEAIFLTVKLSDDPPLAAVAETKNALAEAGFADIRVRHLYHNREEVTVVARGARSGPATPRSR